MPKKIKAFATMIYIKESKLGLIAQISRQKAKLFFKPLSL